MVSAGWCNPTVSHVLFALTFTSWLTTSSGVLAENARNSTTENTKVPETTSLQGTLQGVNMVTRNNRTIYGFMGIPYAEPPVGDLRFKAPVAAGSWNGTFNASSNPSDCPQMDGDTYKGNEDCLYLNLYTPKLRDDENATLLPVMVWIFGGRFRTGTIQIDRFGPGYLLDKDIILVIPNYRLGLLAYLTTGDEVAPGNYGMKDMVLALRWVQDNIQYFGGDPNQVTIFGESSGGMSVSLLTLSNSTKGLFHRYITESGSALNIELGQPREVFVNRTTRVAEYFGCQTNTSTLLIECLRNVNVSQLTETITLFDVWNNVPNDVWYPCVEPDVEGAFLTDSPANLVANGKNHDLPAMSLVTRDEGLVSSIYMYDDPELFEEFLEKLDLLLPYHVSHYNKVEDVAAFTAALKAYYLNDLTANRSLLLTNVTQLLGDAAFVYPAYRMIQQQLVHMTSPLYFSSFEYESNFSNNYAWTGSTNYGGVAHGNELIYIFENSNNRYAPADYEFSESDWIMVDTMVQLWTSFVINGTPILEDAEDPNIWQPYSSLNNYLRIGDGSDTTLEMKRDLFIERMQFWDELVASTSGDFQNQVELLLIMLCLFVLSAHY